MTYLSNQSFWLHIFQRESLGFYFVSFRRKIIKGFNSNKRLTSLNFYFLSIKNKEKLEYIITQWQTIRPEHHFMDTEHLVRTVCLISKDWFKLTDKQCDYVGHSQSRNIVRNRHVSIVALNHHLKER